jgi:hypothetical protein
VWVSGGRKNGKVIAGPEPNSGGSAHVGASVPEDRGVTVSRIPKR